MLRFVAIIAGVCACKDPAPPSPPIAGPSVASIPAGSGSQAPAVAPAPVARDPIAARSTTRHADVARLPETIPLVIGIDVKAAFASAAWKSLLEPKLLRAHLLELQTRCGYDPLASATTATIGATTTHVATADFLAIVHDFDVAAFRACLDVLAGLRHPGETLERDTTIAVRTANGVSTAFYIVDERTVLIVTPRGSRDAVIAMAARQSKLTTDRETILANLDSRATLWAIANPKLDLGAFEPTTVFGSAMLADAIAFDVNLRMRTMQHATQFAMLARGQVRTSPLLEVTDIQAIGTDVQFRGALSRDQVRQAAAKETGLLELGLE